MCLFSKPRQHLAVGGKVTTVVQNCQIYSHAREEEYKATLRKAQQQPQQCLYKVRVSWWGSIHAAAATGTRLTRFVATVATAVATAVATGPIHVATVVTAKER